MDEKRYVRPQDSAVVKEMLRTAAGNDEAATARTIDALASRLAGLENALKVARLEAIQQAQAFAGQLRGLEAGLIRRRVTDEPNWRKVEIPESKVMVGGGGDLAEMSLYVEADSETTVQVSAGNINLATLLFDYYCAFAGFQTTNVSVGADASLGSEAEPYIFLNSDGSLDSAAAYQAPNGNILDAVEIGVIKTLAKLEFTDAVISGITRYNLGNIDATIGQQFY